MYYLNGSYILGFGNKNKKPFENLSLIMEAESDVINYLNKDKELKEIAVKTREFLSGFYSSFGLELLSTVDYISNNYGAKEAGKIIEEIESWSDRKKTLFNNEKFIEISLERLRTAKFIK